MKTIRSGSIRTATSILFLLLLALTPFIHAISLPLSPNDLSNTGLSSSLEKRKGGGGGGHGGGGGGRGGSSGGHGSSSSGSSSSRPGNTLGTSNSGGRTSGGSGVRPAYRGGSGGAVYAGGAAAPYTAGLRSPTGGILPRLLLVGALIWWVGPHHWSNNVYEYQYPANVTYYNQTSHTNMTVPAICLCERYLECSCDAVSGANQTAYVNSLIGNGSYATLQSNQQLVQLDLINGTKTLAINGTLANGTTAASAADAGRRGLLGSAGGLVIGAAFAVSVLLI